MSIEDIRGVVLSLDGILELAPDAGSDFPEVAWGDHFFYYAPDGEVPQNEQPFATIVTKDYPDDTASRLGSGEGRWRVNIHVGSEAFEQLTGETPAAFREGDPADYDFALEDVFVPHPVYGALGWVSVVLPDERTESTLYELLRAAHAAARARYDRRRRQVE